MRLRRLVGAPIDFICSRLWIPLTTHSTIRSTISFRVRVGEHCTIQRHCIIAHGVSIGSFTFINDHARIDPNTSRIGKFCSISHDVKIGVGSHPTDWVSTSPVFYSRGRGFVRSDLYDDIAEDGPTVIGNDVLIGASAIILSGVTIGDGAVIGAGAVVTSDVEPYSIVAGMPARLIKYRFDPETRRNLADSRWWDFDVRWLLEHGRMRSPDALLHAIQDSRVKPTKPGTNTETNPKG